MRILLSYESFRGFGGTETYVLTVAQELQSLGHDVAVFSPNRGAIAEHARAMGTRVLEASELPSERDLVLASDGATASDLAGRYPSAVRVFVVHSADFALQAPPQLDAIAHAVVVLNDRVARAVKARAWHAPLHRLRQPITLGRFWNLGPPRSPARVALISSNYVSGVRADMIERACRDAGLEARWLGLSNPSAFPEGEIAQADIVIGLGRSVLEGMAAGRAGFVYGIAGADGWVTAERYEQMEADGFAGMARRQAMFDEAALTEELLAWRPDLGELGRDLTSAHHSAREHAMELLALAGQHLDPSPADPGPLSEISRLIRLEWGRDQQAHASHLHSAQLRAELDQRQAEIASLRAARHELRLEARGLREQLEALQAHHRRLLATRRYRLAGLLARPLDRARALLGRRGA